MWPLLVGAAPPPSLLGMKGRARLERVADLAAVVVIAPFWLALEDEPADARWIPLSPLELPDLKGIGWVLVY